MKVPAKPIDSWSRGIRRHFLVESTFESLQQALSLKMEATVKRDLSSFTSASGPNVGLQSQNGGGDMQGDQSEGLTSTSAFVSSSSASVASPSGPISLADWLSANRLPDSATLGAVFNNYRHGNADGSEANGPAGLAEDRAVGRRVGSLSFEAALAGLTVDETEARSGESRQKEALHCLLGEYRLVGLSISLSFVDPYVGVCFTSAVSAST
ncbi:unnamed protein product, partial [Protopolystoma xenopodis]